MHVILRTAIIREICASGDRVMELLTNTKGSLDPQFFKDAIRVAIEMDSDVNIGYLALCDQVDVPDYIKFAEDKRKPHAKAMLLLIMAAQAGDMDMLCKLRLKTVDKETFGNDSKFPLIHSSLLLVNITPTVPIEIARKNGHFQVRNEIVMKTNVYADEKEVNWSGMQLKELDASWANRISWVERLKLCRNRLTVLQNEIGQYLQQVMNNN